MVKLIDLRVSYTGFLYRVSWEVPFEAQQVGVTPKRAVRSVHAGDTLGSPDGCDLVELYARAGLDRALHELQGAWSTPKMF